MAFFPSRRILDQEAINDDALSTSWNIDLLQGDGERMRQRHRSMGT